MTFRVTPDEAVEAGAPASPYLMRNLRDNDEAVGNYIQTLDEMLDDAIGHVHGTGTRTHTYTFTDHVRIVTGVNDKLPFRFGGTSQVATDESSTLTAGVYTLTELAAEIQSKMRASASASTEISVVYDLADGSSPYMPEGSVNRGHFVFRHTGTSDSPNTRVLELHFATGTGFAAGVGPWIGFAKLDRKKAFAYSSDSGFSDGYTQDQYAPTEGGLLSTDAWVAGAFTSGKIADNTISTRCFQNSSVEGSDGADKIQDGTLTYDKLGPPVASSQVTCPGAGTVDIDVTTSNGGSGRTPMVVPYTTGTASDVNDCKFEVVSVTHLSGNDWRIRIGLQSAFARFVKLAIY